MFLTSDITFYNLLALNVKISDKQLSRRISHEGTSLIYGKPKQTLAYMLPNMIQSPTEMKRNFSGHRSFHSYITEATH